MHILKQIPTSVNNIGDLLPEDLLIWAQKTVAKTRRSLEKQSIPLHIDKSPVSVTIEAQLACDTKRGGRIVLILPNDAAPL